MSDEVPVEAAPTDASRQRRRVLRVMLVAQSVVALLTGCLVAFGYHRLDANLEVLPEIPHRASPPAATGPRQPINVLVMGSDTRACAGCDIDGHADGGARSDVTMLLHVSADRRAAYGVSLARDTVVDRPDCEVAGDTLPGADDVMFNDAFSVGGPLCTVQQVEQLTGIYVDHTVVVDFRGFRDMVDAVHGVEVCLPRDVDDPAHGIHLDAGTRLVSGEEALAYVRERHVLSVNSDLGRMKRQQAFVASMVDRVLSAGTMANPHRLYRFLDAATDSVQLDSDLASLRKVYDLGRELEHIDLRHIRFATVPVEAYPPDPNRLQFAPAARDLWQTIRDDEPLGRFSRGAITAGDPVGDPDGVAHTDDEQDRRANGLCA